MLCTPVFIFTCTSGSSALLGCPRYDLLIWLSLLAILFNTLFELMPFYEKPDNMLEVCHFSMIQKWLPTLTRRAKHWYWENFFKLVYMEFNFSEDQWWHCQSLVIARNKCSITPSKVWSAWNIGEELVLVMWCFTELYHIRELEQRELLVKKDLRIDQTFVKHYFWFTVSCIWNL